MNGSGLTFQDVSKKGLKYGDEDEHEAEKAEVAAQNKAFAPLLKWLKSQFEGNVADGWWTWVLRAMGHE
jgi:heat shock protein beta